MPTQIIVICDNCTDNTVHLVNNFINNTSINISILETIDNNAKKAGALNQAFAKINLEDYVLIMDADTSLDRSALKCALDLMRTDAKMGAVCSRAGILPFEGKSLWKKIIWSLQHIEYGQFDSHRVETQNRIKVAHGMATLFKTEALKSVPKYRKINLNIESNVFLEDSLVGDYELTLCLKHEWRVSSCMNMLAWTDVPLSLKELWIQRLRWLRGGVDALRVHSFNKVTALEILNHVLFIFLMTLRTFALVISIKHLMQFGYQGFNNLVLGVVLVAFIDSVYRLKYVQNKKAFDYVIKLSIIPVVLYEWFQAFVLIQSYIMSFCNIKQKW